MDENSIYNKKQNQSDNKVYSLLEILSLNNENETIKNIYKVLKKNDDLEIQAND